MTYAKHRTAKQSQNAAVDWCVSSIRESSGLKVQKEFNFKKSNDELLIVTYRRQTYKA